MNKPLRNLAKKGRQSEFFWRYGFNFSPTVSYITGLSDKLNPFEKEIVEGLNKNGIAFSSVENLLPANSSFEEMDSTVNSILESRKEELAELKLRANDESSIGDKTFNLEMLGSELNFAADNVFARFALNDTFLNIANSYFQMYAKLRYYNVWKTFASNSSPRESQLWHFDREDRYILKMFLYLSDVDEGAGPFTYAPETHKKGKLNNLKPESFIEGGVQRTNDEQMKEVFPEDKWVKGTGKRGTIIFADTRGFHKGGEARTNDRLMFTCMFTSSASESRKLINYPQDLSLNSFNKKQLKALNF